MRRLWILLGWSAFVACGGKDHPAAIPPSLGSGGNTNIGTSGGTAGAATTTTGGKANTGGSFSSAGAAGDQGEAGEGGANSLAPIVEILSPLEVLDPNVGGVLVGASADKVKVTCKATQSTEPGSTAVDASTVLITVLDADDKTVRQLAGDLTTASTYTATLLVGEIGNGPLKFRCTAADKSRPPNTGAAQISTFIDRGPDITATEPKVDSPHALVGSTHFAFTVAPSPLWSLDDPGAAVSNVTLSANGVVIEPLTVDKKLPGTYTAEVDFNDTKLFKEPPSGSIPVTITATDKRLPAAATRTLSYNFLLDGAGPVVTITSPPNNTVVGKKNQITIGFTVKDEGAGVDPESIVVLLGNEPHAFKSGDSSWTAKDGGAYTFTFDFTLFPADIQTQLTVNVQAQDKAGNQGHSDTLFLRPDYFSPVVSLDPPMARILTPGEGGTKTYCSAPFDPLGDAVNDGETKPLLTLFRAFIWERTNVVDSSDLVYYAQVKPDSPHLYLQADLSKPLLIDTNGDGECDAINPDVQSLASLKLMPVTPAGIGNTNAPLDLVSEPALPQGLVCSSQSVDLKYLCPENTSDMLFVAAQHVIGANLPAVWASSVTSDFCTGAKWELEPTIASNGEGWLCVAASAEDKVGNSAVSPPLRVCFDDKSIAGTPDCAGPSSTTPPSCTDGCRPPKQDFGGGDGQPFLIRY